MRRERRDKTSKAVAQPAPQPHRHGANRRRENLPGLCVGRPSLQAGLHRPLFHFKTAELLAEIKFAKVDGSFPKLRKQLATFDLILLD